MSKVKIIHKSSGKVLIEKTKHIYELNINNGNVVKADLMELDKDNGCRAYRLIEKPSCMYMPADSLELAKKNFDITFRHAKYGNIKLSFKEWIAKWWTVFNIKIKKWGK